MAAPRRPLSGVAHEAVTITALPVTDLNSPPAPVSITFPDPVDWENLDLVYDTGTR